MSNKSKGNTGELIILEHLRSKGMIGEIIETKMRLSRFGGRAVLVPDSGAKLGDIYGLLSGKAVLVEVKTVDSLTYSVLKEHQHENLRKWKQAGGISLLAHVIDPSMFFIYEYPMNWERGSLPRDVIQAQL